MKLLITIVQNDDVPALTDEIVRNGFSATKLASTGGLLRNGSTTLLIGIDEKDMDKILSIIKQTCRERTIKMQDNLGLAEAGMSYRYQSGYEVTVGGATIFVLDVEQFLHL